MSLSPDRVTTLVRAADPLDADDLDAWLASPQRAELAAHIVASPREPTRRRRTRSRAVVIAAAGSLAVGGAAAAAATILGGPAPDSVRAHLAQLDAGMPPDLRYNPDLDHARAVAATDAATLYAADLADGGYCIEIAAPGGQPRGGSCVSAADATQRPIEVIAPLPTGEDAPVVIGGHLNSASLATLTVTVPGFAAQSIGLGLDRFFLAEVPMAARDAALAHGAILTAGDAAGDPVSQVRVPPLHDDGDALGDRQPIFVSTMSDAADLTLVTGIEGRVNVAGATALYLTYPDGTVVRVPTEPDRTYRMTLPAERHDDFARAFGVLTARDAAGHTLATAPVGSVAAWRARDH